ncbi:ABC transporter ATP-binding protein, partial [Gammaproteobacteria bacterium]|nr:ABC transporter ATP-binding protein [Gammaproteobacteria bacterium]
MIDTTATPVFAARQLGWCVGDPSRRILDGIDLRIDSGEFVGVIGPNGAGKSTLLRCLYGAISDFNGELDYCGQPIARYSRRELAQHIAVVLQESPQPFAQTVRELVSMGQIPHQRLLQLETRTDREQIEAALAAVDIAEHIDRDLNTLSGGERQRAMIARAIAQRPQVLVMDEPTNHL